MALFAAPVVAQQPVTVTIDVATLGELSGLASSRLRDGLLWAHNDGGNEPRLYAIGIDGKSLGSVLVDGASATDWEDIASFELDGASYLVIGDVGDNDAVRKKVALLFIREPAIVGDRVEKDLVVRPEWIVEFSYEDGPRDCESVAVDVPGERILLMSKRTKPPAVYTIPFRSAGAVATRITDRVSIPTLDKKDSRLLAAIGRFATQPTSMDVTPDGRLAIVQTYTDAWLFRRAPDQAWGDAFAGEPERLRVPPLLQAEAIAFDREGVHVFVSGEGTPNPLVRIERD